MNTDIAQQSGQWKWHSVMAASMNESDFSILVARITSYCIDVSPSASDSFIDVGCGQGRVLAFLLSQHYPCSISGVELNESIGKVAEGWTKKYPNINIFIGDAFSLDYNNYTVLFLSQPFYPKVFYKFVDLLETQLKHKITLIYLFDHSSGGYLENRPGWNLQYREEFFRIHGLQVVGAIRRYSIWTYIPEGEESKESSEAGD